jgi:YXWGXW repeat-containing protein
MKNIFVALLLTAAFSFPSVKSSAQFSLSVGITVRTAPPPLPVYAQPACPFDGYLWSPGYWAYDDIDGYYWVPGAWILPPMVGYLWTPGYWGYAGGIYGWHGGYWGTHIGFYGGVNYGYGYGGSGFVGGAWQGSSFRYNTAVVNVNTTVVHNVYVDRTVINNTTINNTTVNNRASFNGTGGTSAQPNTQEQAAMHESHVPPTTQQLSHNQAASKDRNQFASVNHGRPVTTAMDKPGGSRFNQLGKNAPPPIARPANGIKAGNSNRAITESNHPGNQPRAIHPAGNNQQPSKPANRPTQQHNNKPAQSMPRQQPPRNNGHPQPQHGGAEGTHHKEH